MWKSNIYYGEERMKHYLGRLTYLKGIMFGMTGVIYKDVIAVELHKGEKDE